MSDDPAYKRCRKVLALLNEEQGWKLSNATCDQYAEDIAARVSHHAINADNLRTIIVNYYLDHALVASLRDHQHPNHDAQLQAWLQQIVRILRHNGLAQSTDSAVDQEDFVQIAATALVKALPSFQYSSRFSTWAYQVIIQSIQRTIRDSNAKKRRVRPESLDRLLDTSLCSNEREHPEIYADASVLRDLVIHILQSHPDPRLAVIFVLKEEHDRPIAEIGGHVHVSPQRVRALLAVIRDTLRNDPLIQAWLADIVPETQEPRDKRS